MDNKELKRDAGVRYPTFSGGVCLLTLEDLRESLGWQDSRGRLPSRRPVEHWDCLDEIRNLAMDVTKNMDGVAIGEWDIRCDQGSSLQVGWRDKERECPLGSYLFQRLVGILPIGISGDDALGMGVVVGYSDKGIEVGFGSRVWVCNNQNIYGNRVMGTGGSDGISWEGIKSELYQWLLGIVDQHTLEVTYRIGFKSMEISERDIYFIIGKLLWDGVGQYAGDVSAGLLGITQVTDMCRRIYDGRVGGSVITMWDLLNVGTNVLRVEDGGDMTRGLRRVQYFCNLIKDHYDLSALIKSYSDKNEGKEGDGTAEGEVKEPQ